AFCGSHNVVAHYGAAHFLRLELRRCFLGRDDGTSRPTNEPGQLQRYEPSNPELYQQLAIFMSGPIRGVSKIALRQARARLNPLELGHPLKLKPFARLEPAIQKLLYPSLGM